MAYLVKPSHEAKEKLSREKARHTRQEKFACMSAARRIRDAAWKIADYGDTVEAQALLACADRITLHNFRLVAKQVELRHGIAVMGFDRD